MPRLTPKLIHAAPTVTVTRLIDASYHHGFPDSNVRPSLHYNNLMFSVEQIVRNFSLTRSVMMSMTATTEMLHGPIRGVVEGQIEGLKQRLLSPILESVSSTDLVKEISWAANEAAALAWLTVCPVLVLPALLDEKVHDALKKWDKQQNVLRR